MCSVSLILLDINLPNGNGLDLLQEIKESTPELPVIMLTANDTDMDIVDGLEQGADDYITKPIGRTLMLFLFYEAPSYEQNFSFLISCLITCNISS